LVQVPHCSDEVHTAPPLGEGDGEPAVGLGPGTVEPVHTTPLRVNEVGAELVPVQVPLKPGVTVALVPRPAFQDSLVTVTREPFWLKTPFHPWVTVWPLAKVHSSRQPLSGSPRLVTATLPVNPPGHSFTVYATRQPVAALAWVAAMATRPAPDTSTAVSPIAARLNTGLITGLLAVVVPIKLDDQTKYGSILPARPASGNHHRRFDRHSGHPRSRVRHPRPRAPGAVDQPSNARS
jgi:hypothetical protein